MSFLRQDIILRSLSWFTLFFSMICCFSNLNEVQLEMFYSSDSLFFPSLYKDLVYDGGSLKDWYPGPVVFPDFIIYYIINRPFHLSLLQAHTLFGLVQVTIIVAMLQFIFRKCVRSELKKYTWMIPFLFSIFFIESYYFSLDIFTATLLFAYSFHTGAFVSTLIVVAIYLSDLNKALKYFLIFIVSALSIYSDMLFLVTLVVPLSLAVINFKRGKILYNFLFILCIVGGMFAGQKLIQYMRVAGYLKTDTPQNMYQFDYVLESINIFLTQMKDYLKYPGFRIGHFLFTFIAIPVCGFLFLWNRKEYSDNQKFLFKFFVIFSCCVLAAPIINGNYRGYDTLRYNISVFYFSIIMLALFLAGILEFKVKYEYIKQAISYALPLIFIIMVSFKFSLGGVKDHYSYKPPRVAEIDSVCKKYNLKRGISEYWTAKWTTMFSDNKIRVLATFNTLHIQELGSNVNWYRQGDFDFVISNKLDSAAIAKTFNIKDTIKTKNYSILLVDKFNFPEGQYSPVTR